MRFPARRRALLFVVALTAPSVVVIALGVILLRQGDELDARRLDDTRALQVQRIAADLSARLDRIKLVEANALAAKPSLSSDTRPASSAVAVVGEVRDDRLILPWDAADAGAPFRAALADRRYADAIAQGERREFAADFAAAEASYRFARSLAPDTTAAAYADLLRARALVKCDCSDEAATLYETLLKSDVRDDQGMPLALYAAGAVLDLERNHDGVIDTLTSRFGPSAGLTPAALFRERELVQRIADRAPQPAQRKIAGALLAALETTVHDVEQALALQREFARVRPRTGTEMQSTWTMFGDAPWLVSEVPLAGRPVIVVAIRAQPIFASFAGIGEAPEFLMDGSAGVPLDGFPGLRVVPPPIDAAAVSTAAGLQRLFFVTAIAAVLSVTCLGGWIVWRDVRRELRLADLRSQFVASVSHELKTPLTAIRMFAETLQMDRPLDPSVRGEYLNTIVHESERLSRLINNVLDLSKIERGEKVYHLEAGSLAAIVRGAAASMEYPLTLHGFRLRLTVDDTVPAARVDGDAIQQAILNLLSNAMKYSRGERDISLTLTAAGGHAVIEVSDRGLGIAAAEQSKIFERFYRSAIPENRLIPGTGLGLAVVDHIVRAHGGFVRVTSAPGSGSTFGIHLPVDGEDLSLRGATA